MNSSDHDPADERLRRALHSLAVPETPAGMESRVQSRLRNRRVQQAAGVTSIAAILLVGLFAWQPWGGEPVGPDPQQPQIFAQAPPREIPADDLAVLFAPPPVDSLDVLARRDAVSIAAISRMEGVK
jgi:hypothetical protein